MSWKEVTLEQVTTKIGDGLHGTPKYDESGEFFFVNGNNLSQGKVVLKSDTKRISKSEYERIKKDLNDRTVFVAINGTLGNVGMYGGEKIALGKSACYLNVKEDVNKYFIRYVLDDRTFQDYAYRFATGATIKNLGLKAVRGYNFQLPPLPTQKKIADILSAYDNLIENNLKRIKLLEEASLNIYKEWFVNFRFPNHENTPIDEEAGLPVGWQKKRSDEVFTINIGKTPPRKESHWFSELEGVKWVSISDMNKSKVFIKGTSERIVKEGVDKFNVKVVPKGTVLLSFKLTIGAVGIATENMVTNEAIAHFNISENTPSTAYTYCYLKTFPYQILGSTSSIGKALNSKIVKRMEFVVPRYEILNEFDDKVDAIFHQIDNLVTQNLKLKEARDILLPRLMNRTIEV